MKLKHQNIKIWKTTLSKLRLLKGYLEKSIVVIIDEMVTDALDKARRKDEKSDD